MAANNLEIFRKYSRKTAIKKYGYCCYRLENFKDKLTVGTVKCNEHF